MKILICGAGINGVSCALWLKRAGHDVTLIDRKGPAAGTSYGNAGVLASGSVIPVTIPGLMRKAPGMLFKPSSPLFLRWAYFPKLIPFLLKYMRHANRRHVENYAKNMITILSDSVQQHKDLAEGTGAEGFISDDDYCFAYQSKAAFEADKWSWDIRKSLGLGFKVTSGADFAKTDPLYADAFHTVVRGTGHGRISDPGAYITALFDHFLEIGGTFEQAEVTGITTKDGEIAAVQTTSGNLEADRYVFTLGPWTGGVSSALGLNVPFESEGGYHVELINPSKMPTNPVMVASGKFVVTPMRGRIRLAGVVDFSGLDAPDNQAALNLLKDNVKSLFPDLEYERMDTWHGQRPTTANSLPLIGKINALPNAYVGFGHQHVGLTGGPKTGRLLAGMIDGRDLGLDLDAFDPNKYA